MSVLKLTAHNPRLKCNQYDRDSSHPPLTSCCRGTEELPGPADRVWAGGDHGLRRDLVPRSGLSEARGFPRHTAELWIWWRAWKLRQGERVGLSQNIKAGFLGQKLKIQQCLFVFYFCWMSKAIHLEMLWSVARHANLQEALRKRYSQVLHDSISRRHLNAPPKSLLTKVMKCAPWGILYCIIKCKPELKVTVLLIFNAPV